MKRQITAILNSYSEILFLKNFRIGAAYLLVTFLFPGMALAGLISVIAAYLFARFIKMDREFLNSGFYTYNPLLVGLSIGYLFSITPLTVFFIAGAGIVTFIFTIISANIFSTYFGLPILSLPFALVSSVSYLASAKYSNLYVNNLQAPSPVFTDPELPLWAAGFFKSMGAVFFMPYVIPGIIITLMILAASRILFLLAAAGYYTGAVITGILSGSMQQSFGNLMLFNHILIAMALGGILLIPSPRSYLIALIAVAASTMFNDAILYFWSSYRIPVFTLPFNIITLSFLYVLRIVKFQYVAYAPKGSPESTLDYFITHIARYSGSQNTVYLPFSGTWTVWQGFDGNWTHQGIWKYAYDFVITDDNGNTYSDNGISLTDYFAFRKPVLSPVKGRIIKIVNDIDDNKPGEVDRTNNWGNLVLIWDERGFYVELSHFACGSIAVKQGDWVERGTLLGLCGNSGNSPQPHIHIQAQVIEQIGSYTMPFSFASYISGNKFCSNDLPLQNENVEPAFPDKQRDHATTFLPDDVVEFDIIERGKPAGGISLSVKMAADGSSYFDSGKGQLFFGKHEGTFYIYHLEGSDRHLRAVFIAMARLPLIKREGIFWHDYIPAGVTVHGIIKNILLFASSFYHGLVRFKADYNFTTENTVQGIISSKFLSERIKTSVEFDSITGIKKIIAGDIEMKRIIKDINKEAHL